MSVRPRMLPEGWYPAVRREVETKLGAWDRVDAASHAENALACIGPHAGWYFSGRIAWAAWRSAADSDAVVIIGGHLPAGSGFRFSPEDGYETPLGVIVADKDLRDAVARTVSAAADKSADNTVEAHLPMAAHRFPGIPVACFRASNDAHAARLGSAIAGYATSTGRRIFVIGSTDLTHYGAAYGFEPAGHGPEGFPWARRADKAIVETFMAMDEVAALKRAESDGSACSVGAAIAAMAYAKGMNAARPRLLMRGSSDEIAPGGDSSVGYCAVAFMR